MVVIIITESTLITFKQVMVVINVFKQPNFTAITDAQNEIYTCC